MYRHRYALLYRESVVLPDVRSTERIIFTFQLGLCQDVFGHLGARS